MILNRLADELGELAIIEQRPQQDGRNMTMMLGPGREAAADDAAAPDREPETAQARSRPQSRPPGSADPAPVSPEQI
jgi:translation initiation factor IF-3